MLAQCLFAVSLIALNLNCNCNGFCLAAENKVKAGKLPVMEALLASLTLHKASETIAEAVSGAFRIICLNGISFM